MIRFSSTFFQKLVPTQLSKILLLSCCMVRVVVTLNNSEWTCSNISSKVNVIVFKWQFFLCSSCLTQNQCCHCSNVTWCWTDDVNPSGLNTYFLQNFWVDFHYFAQYIIGINHKFFQNISHFQFICALSDTV